MKRERERKKVNCSNEVSVVSIAHKLAHIQLNRALNYKTIKIIYKYKYINFKIKLFF